MTTTTYQTYLNNIIQSPTYTQQWRLIQQSIQEGQWKDYSKAIVILWIQEDQTHPNLSYYWEIVLLQLRDLYRVLFHLTNRWNIVIDSIVEWSELASIVSEATILYFRYCTSLSSSAIRDLRPVVKQCSPINETVEQQLNQYYSYYRKHVRMLEGNQVENEEDIDRDNPDEKISVGNGFLTKRPMIEIIQALQLAAASAYESKDVFVDIGSGYGAALMHTIIQTQGHLAAYYGIEIESGRATISKNLLTHESAAFTNQWEIYIGNANNYEKDSNIERIMNAGTLLNSFDKVWTHDSLINMSKQLEKRTTWKVFISYHSPRKWATLGDLMDRVLVFGQLPARTMSGSGGSFTAYVYINKYYQLSSSFIQPIIDQKIENKESIIPIKRTRGKKQKSTQMDIILKVKPIENMNVYFYVEKEKLESIKKYGLLSTRTYYNIFKELPTEKYVSQYKKACETYPELLELTKNLDLNEAILIYLDWRDEAFNSTGSSAIYFLYYPVPNEKFINDYITKYRQQFTKDRILLQYNLTSEYCKIGEFDIKNNNRKYWIDIWKNLPKKNDLWFAGIPHGYFVPENGKIDFKDLTIINIEDFERKESKLKPTIQQNNNIDENTTHNSNSNNKPGITSRDSILVSSVEEGIAKLQSGEMEVAIIPISEEERTLLYDTVKNNWKELFQWFNDDILNEQHQLPLDKISYKHIMGEEDWPKLKNKFKFSFPNYGSGMVNKYWSTIHETTLQLPTITQFFDHKLGPDWLIAPNRFRVALPKTATLESTHTDHSMTNIDRVGALASIVSLSNGRCFTWFKGTSTKSQMANIQQQYQTEADLNPDKHYVTYHITKENDPLQLLDHRTQVYMQFGDLLLFNDNLLHEVAENDTKRAQTSIFLSPYRAGTVPLGDLKKLTKFAKTYTQRYFPDTMSVPDANKLSVLLGIAPPFWPSGKPTFLIGTQARAYANNYFQDDALIEYKDKDGKIMHAPVEPLPEGTVIVSELKLDDLDIPQEAFKYDVWYVDPTQLSPILQYRLGFRKEFPRDIRNATLTFIDKSKSPHIQYTAEVLDTVANGDCGYDALRIASGISVSITQLRDQIYNIEQELTNPAYKNNFAFNQYFQNSYVSTNYFHQTYAEAIKKRYTSRQTMDGWMSTFEAIIAGLFLLNADIITVELSATGTIVRNITSTYRNKLEIKLVSAPQTIYLFNTKLSHPLLYKPNEPNDHWMALRIIESKELKEESNTQPQIMEIDSSQNSTNLSTNTYDQTFTIYNILLSEIESNTMPDYTFDSLQQNWKGYHYTEQQPEQQHINYVQWVEQEAKVINQFDQFQFPIQESIPPYTLNELVVISEALLMHIENVMAIYQNQHANPSTELSSHRCFEFKEILYNKFLAVHMPYQFTIQHGYFQIDHVELARLGDEDEIERYASRLVYKQNPLHPQHTWLVLANSDMILDLNLDEYKSDIYIPLQSEELTIFTNHQNTYLSSHLRQFILSTTSSTNNKYLDSRKIELWLNKNAEATWISTRSAFYQKRYHPLTSNTNNEYHPLTTAQQSDFKTVIYN